MTDGRVLPDLAAATAALRAGDVVLMPTDTLPGLHARADTTAALARLIELKGREAGKPLLVLAGSFDQAWTLAEPPSPRVRGLLEECWPGPFSFILGARPRVEAAVTAGGATVAVRIPAVAWLRELALQVGAPLASTSANAPGEPPAVDLERARAGFGDRVAVFAGAGEPEGAGAPSALVDATRWPPCVLRPGSRPLPGF